MDTNMAYLSKRLQKIETEAEIARRKRASEVFKAEKALKEISPDDIELLSGIVPSLRIVTAYTSEEISNNRNGEIDTIRATMESLRQYLEARLKYYEEQL